jgi:hypothetical protein
MKLHTRQLLFVLCGERRVLQFDRRGKQVRRNLPVVAYREVVPLSTVRACRMSNLLFIATRSFAETTVQ